MNLYLLLEVHAQRPRIYDVAVGFVVAAETELDARVLASERSGDEGEEPWLDATKSTCEVIGATYKPRGVILRDFVAG